MIKKVEVILFISLAIIITIILLTSKSKTHYIKDEIIKDPKLNYKKYTPDSSDTVSYTHLTLPTKA